MTFHRRIDPADDLPVKNCGEGDPVVRAQRLLDATAKIVDRARIAKLAAQLRCRICIVGREPANRKPRSVSFGIVSHADIIARPGFAFPEDNGAHTITLA